jgi:hypothetical protein
MSRFSDERGRSRVSVESVEALFEAMPEADGFRRACDLFDQARLAAGERCDERSAALYAECLGAIDASDPWIRSLRVMALDEQATVLHRLGQTDKAQRATGEALRVRSDFVASLLAKEGSVADAKHRVLLDDVLPRLVPFVDLLESGGGLLCFKRAPHSEILQAGERLGFSFFRQRLGACSHLDLLDLCLPHADETTYGGHVALPPREDARLRLTSLRTPFSSRLGPLIRDAKQVDGEQVYGNHVRLTWRC